MDQWQWGKERKMLGISGGEWEIGGNGAGGQMKDVSGKKAREEKNQLFKQKVHLANYRIPEAAERQQFFLGQREQRGWGRRPHNVWATEARLRTLNVKTISVVWCVCVCRTITNCVCQVRSVWSIHCRDEQKSFRERSSWQVLLFLTIRTLQYVYFSLINWNCWLQRSWKRRRYCLFHF